ncbi:transporter [Streptomyces venezuelae]|uniref:Transporter n=1 Tax=Streptomyces venezuelae TaxID=54571 RepID=A0A5P2D3M3_STRVZ|nr:heavy-metal-associated domain-containing protein [Streptomyces venezuelae]QES47719.1 transporter [Streptomyces venezuelae]
MEERRYTVTGMTCGHCVAGVTEELSAVAGVTGVEVELADGSVVVRGSGLEDATLRATITEAGYGLADTAAPAPTG